MLRASNTGKYCAVRTNALKLGVLHSSNTGKYCVVRTNGLQLSMLRASNTEKYYAVRTNALKLDVLHTYNTGNYCVVRTSALQLGVLHASNTGKYYAVRTNALKLGVLRTSNRGKYCIVRANAVKLGVLRTSINTGKYCVVKANALKLSVMHIQYEINARKLRLHPRIKSATFCVLAPLRRKLDILPSHRVLLRRNIIGYRCAITYSQHGSTLHCIVSPLGCSHYPAINISIGYCRNVFDGPAYPVLLPRNTFFPDCLCPRVSLVPMVHLMR